MPSPATISFDVRPEDLTEFDVDIEVRQAVARINASGWVWTTWSCQGHMEHNGYTMPYLGLVVKQEHLGMLLEILYDAADAKTCRWFELSPEPCEDKDWRRFNVYPAVPSTASNDSDFGNARQFMHLAARRIHAAGVS